MDFITYEQFQAVDIRVGRIIKVEPFERARNPSFKLKIDFGPELGIKHSSAQLRTDYSPQELVQKQCLAVVNFEPRNIAGFMSEVLVLGVPREDGGMSLVTPLDPAENGGRMY